MRTTMAATLESAQGQVVLDEVGIDAAVDGLMTVVDVCQRYRNPGTGHIEAVYTFPLPVDAVLLRFSVEIGDRTMAGTVIAKPEAERRYEDAITDGDAAVLLEQPQPGLYTASVGNLAPGETATVHFRYGLLLRWNGDLVRLAMPTTIAPRYGDPPAGGLEPHQQPEFAFDAERSFRLRVSVRGVLQGARWASPSHDIAVTPDRERTVIEIARPAAMDRDCVLEARATGVDAGRALLDRDGGDWVVLASFRPEIPDLGESGTHRCLKIVVDCSGSMSGDSIEQVRIAGERILDSLRPGDLFDIVAFGTGHRALFGRAMPASPANVARAREFVRDLDADLGGTEIESALRAAYAIEGEPGIPRDLLLITDGEVWDTDAAVSEARASGHRIFTVGVGSQRLEIGPLPPRDAGVAGADAARSDLARMGAAQRLPAIGDEAAATELAVRYQLLSEWTDCLIVHVRAEADKADDLPTLVKVPQVLAAGWHGIGTVHDAALAPMKAMYSQAPPPPEAAVSPLPDMIAPAPDPMPGTIRSPVEIVAAMNEHSLPDMPTLDDLAALGIPDEFIDRLRELADTGEDARAVAVIFLYLICESPAGSGLDRRQRRLILSAYKKLRAGAATLSAVRGVWQDWDLGGAPSYW